MLSDFCEHREVYSHAKVHVRCSMFQSAFESCKATKYSINFQLDNIASTSRLTWSATLVQRIICRHKSPFESRVAQIVQRI